MAPRSRSDDRTNYTTPNMMMIGTEDSVVGEDWNGRSRQYYEESKGPRYLVEIRDALQRAALAAIERPGAVTFPENILIDSAA